MNHRQLSAYIFAILGCVLLGSYSNAADIVTDWNAILRTTMQNVPSKANPGSSTRALAMTNGAIYDIFQSLDRTHKPLQYNHKVSGASLEAAVAQAAYRTITHNYGERDTFLQNELDLRLNSIADTPEKTAGIALGNAVADKYIAWRAGDGAELSGTYTVNPVAGHWSTDPFATNPQAAWGPGWGTVETFGLQSAMQFSVPGVPNMTSAEYTQNYIELKEKGALTGSTRTAEETEIGLFWAYDRPTMGPPPVLYSKNLEEISEQLGNTPAENARLFAMTSVAMADASVAAWQIKFIEDFWRPVTAIQRGDEDDNPSTVADPNWRPLGAPGLDPNGSTDDFTPAFPAYVSGHATFGGALYQSLRNFYGTDLAAYTLTSAEMPVDDNARSFTDFTTAEWENAVSRIYLGVHWRFDVEDGLVLGNQIANYIDAHYFTAVPEPSSLAMGILSLAGFVSRRNRRSFLR